ncbi:DNA sulfur modification protein DndD [Mesobacillus jeotgali]|uniref:DNA sulfur modification protein DndD n=1 Tax=Mesobacillus jeotgali TaxID=129985 RepID=UPI001787444B|nr:DNA sulfur modification protein DndD [Mesobacillus jeotgali]UYZ24021.1 DNA sulfur modification protein DndD [Mesobacillus jeotgali]
MIINEVQLTNIGAYRGTNTIDIRPVDDKNVILIGGENGAGKTTLLNAIKLGLFGSYGFGYKSENAEYYKKVKGILNNNAKKLGENNFRIKLDFSLIDNFEKTDYTFYRHWKLTQTGIKETFEIVAKGKHYSEYDKELFLSRLKEIMPPHLLDLCLFDGEEISRIVNENLLSGYLRNLSKVVFNLDLFEALETDLETYANQSLDVKKMDGFEKELFDLVEKEKLLRDKVSQIINNRDNLLKDQEEYQVAYNKEKNDFEKFGGLVKTEREDLLKQINRIESERKQNMDKIKDFVSSLLPFYLAKEIVAETREQLKAEESMQLFKQLNERLSIDAFSQAVNKVAKLEDLDTQSKMRNEILNLVKPDTDTIQIHGASFSESSLIENIFLTINSDSNEQALGQIEENKVKLEKIRTLKDKLSINDSTTEFSSMIQNMETLQYSLHDIQVRIEQLESELNGIQKELELTLNSKERLQAILKDRDKTESSFLQSQKIIDFSRKFREIQLKKKLQEVQIEASKMLKKIFRKNDYITSLTIDHVTYDVKLFDAHKDQIEKSTLSAGEKEILLISLIWAIFKCSGRKVPFIFDTLLGRLDKTHKAAVLTEFIPYSGKQAIILSTDSEIDEHHYNLLAPFTAKEYMLEFNVEGHETAVLNQYFPFKQLEVSK